MNEKVYKETEGMKDMTENEMEFRVEKDSIGTKDVPENVYYGVQSLRAAENFHITGLNMHPEIINSLAYIKKAAQTVRQVFLTRDVRRQSFRHVMRFLKESFVRILSLIRFRVVQELL